MRASAGSSLALSPGSPTATRHGLQPAFDLVNEPRAAVSPDGTAFRKGASLLEALLSGTIERTSSISITRRVGLGRYC